MGQNGSAPIPPEALARMGQQHNIQNFQLKAVKKEPIELIPMGQNGSAPIPPEALARMGQQHNIQNFQLKAVKKEPIELIPVGASVHQEPPSNNDNNALPEPVNLQIVKREPVEFIPDEANAHQAPPSNNNNMTAAFEAMKKRVVKTEPIESIPDDSNAHQAPPSNDDKEAVLEPVKKQKKEKKQQNTASKRGRPKSNKPPAAPEKHHDIIEPNADPPPIDDNQQPAVADVNPVDAASITSMDNAPPAKRGKRGSWEYVPSEPRPAYPKGRRQEASNKRQSRELAKLAMDIVDSQHDLTKPPEEWYAGSEFDHNKPISMADRIKNNRRSRDIRHYSPPMKDPELKKVKVAKVAKVIKVAKPPVEKKKRTRKPREVKPMKVAKPVKDKKVVKRRRRPKREETPIEETPIEDTEAQPPLEEESEDEELSTGYDQQPDYCRRREYESDSSNYSNDESDHWERTTGGVRSRGGADPSNTNFSLSDGSTRGDMDDDPSLAANLSPMHMPNGYYGSSLSNSISNEPINYYFEEEVVYVDDEEKEEILYVSPNALVERRLPNQLELIKTLEGRYDDSGVYYRPRLIIITPIKEDTSMDALFSALEREKDAWFLPTLRPSDPASKGRGHIALILPTIDAAESMLISRLLNIGSEFCPIDVQQPGAIWIKPLEPNDFDDQMEDDLVREHLEDIVGRVLHFHKHGDGWIVLLPEREYAKELIKTGSMDGVEFLSFQFNGVYERRINWPLVDVEWARELGMQGI